MAGDAVTKDPAAGATADACYRLIYRSHSLLPDAKTRAASRPYSNRHGPAMPSAASPVR